MLVFDNWYLRELPSDPVEENYMRQVFRACYSRVAPTPVRAPKMLLFSSEVAEKIGLTVEEMQSDQLLQALSGNQTLSGMETYATCYGGHQFGQWAGQLGDGRAIYLGEVIGQGQERYELQLKGAGATPYARMADGRAVLRSSIREFLCSEAMHYLGVPTTRALSLVLTGEEVVRDMFYNGNPRSELGAIVARVSPSFTRFGHFELLAARQDKETLERLVFFTIKRDFPHIECGEHLTEDLLFHWFREVCVRTARLIANWMRVGFVHGVMNTDNMSILGLTIDYGPYGWMDQYEPLWTPNTTDLPGRRYCYAYQAEVAMWNLSCLAQALDVLLPKTDLLFDEVRSFSKMYHSEISRVYANKFGFDAWRDSDESLVEEGLHLLYDSHADFTLFFTHLGGLNLERPSSEGWNSVFYSEQIYVEQKERIDLWLRRYAQRVLGSNFDAERRKVTMQQTNPRFILRNYLAQQAIEKAEQGDDTELRQLYKVLQEPYALHDGDSRWEAKRPDWAKQKAGCSMLSCSS